CWGCRAGARGGYPTAQAETECRLTPAFGLLFSGKDWLSAELSTESGTATLPDVSATLRLGLCECSSSGPGGVCGALRRRELRRGSTGCERLWTAVVVRAPSCQRRGLSLLSAGEDRLAPPVVDIGRRDVVESLVVPAMVVEVDEVRQRGVQSPRARVDEQVQ